LSDAISAEARQLADVAEPLAVIEAVGDTFAALDDALAQIALPRLRAVAELRRQGWSYDRIAAATALSKGRVARLAREARQRQL
jgi:DNA-directed RNA polymerase specialized sigma24 family protein